MFTQNPNLSRVFADDRRRAMLAAANRRHVRHEVRRLRRLRADA